VTGLLGLPGRDRSGPRLIPASGPERLAFGIATIVLSFLVVVALALALAGDRLARNWGETLSETATLQLVAEGGKVEAEARAALDILRRTTGVRSMRIIEIEEQRALLEPWLGSDVEIGALPLPLMIEVTTDPALLEVQALRERLSAVAPHAQFEDHGELQAALTRSASSLGFFGIIALCGLAITLFSIFHLWARSAVLANGGSIRTLRLVGARDRDIGRIFVRRSSTSALVNAAWGTLAGLVLLAFLPTSSEPGFFLVAIGPSGRTWLYHFLVPIGVAVIAWLATALTLRRMLRRWT
jgi:cell division transport system permease protein